MAWMERRGEQFLVRVWHGRQKITDSVHTSHDEASLRLLQLRNMRVLARQRRPGACPTFADWSRTWLRARLVTDETLDHYASQLDNHLIPALGHLHLEQIDADTVRQLAHSPGRLPLGARTLRHTLTLLGTILRDAVKIGYLAHDPTTGIRLQYPDQPRPRITAEQLFEIASRMPNPTLNALVITAGYTGLRPGECTALQRKNLRHDDPRAGGLPYLYIDPLEGSRHEHRGRRWLGPLKNQSSARHVFLPPFLDTLLTHELRPHGELLFARPDGQLLSRNDVRRPWRLACDGDARRAWEPVCRGLRMYDLRHLHRTWMDEDSISEPVQAARLGHRRLRKPRPPLPHLAAAQHALLEAMQSRWQSSI